MKEIFEKVLKYFPKKTTYFKSADYTSLEMFREMLLALNNFAKLLGSDAFSPNYHPRNFIFISLMIYFASVIAEHIYWIHFYKDDTAQMLFCIISVPILIQTFVRIHSFIINRTKLYEVFSYVDKFHQIYYEEATKTVMEECVMYSCHLCLVLSSLMIAGCTLILLYPLIYYFIFGEKILHFGFKLIYVDWNTTKGYNLNVLNNIFAVAGFVISTILVCIDISICVLNSFGQFNVLAIYLNQLDHMAKTNRNGENNAEVKRKIGQIIDLHNFFFNFTDAINDLFVSYYFFDNLLLMMLTSIALFALSQLHFYPSYIIILLAAYQVFVPCFLGTFLYYKGEEFYDNIYNISWYLLPVSDQKSILILLGAAKNIRTMTAGLSMISLEQFVEYCKASWSYFTILDTFT